MLTSLTLFNFSKIKSEQVFRISEYNSFNYEFSKSEPYNGKNDDIATIKEDPSSHYIKKVNISLPSNEKLKEEAFRNEFFTKYDNSFASFCGINERMFTEIYAKGQYTPVINQMGDIKINIDNIIKNLDEFSDYKRLKIHRSVFNRNKKRKLKEKKVNLAPKKSPNLFKTAQKKSNFSDDDIISLEENNLDNKSKSNETNSSEKNENKNKTSPSNSITNSNNESNGKNNDIGNKPHDKTLLNIKRKLKNISINKKKEDLIIVKIKNEPKDHSNKSVENNPFENNRGYIPNNALILSNDNSFKSSNRQDSSNFNKNNVFNFSSNAIKHLSNNSPKKDNPNFPIFTPLNNFDPNDNIGGNINYKLLQSNSLLSPFPLPHGGFHSIFSPNISINSPYNINSLFNDTFNFRNSDINEEEEAQNNNNNNNINEAFNPNNKDKMIDNVEKKENK